MGEPRVPDEIATLDQLLLDLRDLGWLTPSDALLLRESRDWWADSRSDAISLDLAALQAENERLRVALSYISSPTMGLPGGVDAADFALDGATEEAVRRALHTCIHTARRASLSARPVITVYEAFKLELDKVTIMADMPAAAVVGECLRACKRAQMAVDALAAPIPQEDDRDNDELAPTLCRRCWSMTWTSDLGFCGKCDAPKDDGEAKQSGSSAAPIPQEDDRG